MYIIIKPKSQISENTNLFFVEVVNAYNLFCFFLRKSNLYLDKSIPGFWILVWGVLKRLFGARKKIQSNYGG